MLFEAQGGICPLTHLGEGEGSWPVPLHLLPVGSVCYCVGVGDNATFDIALAKLGHEVHSFDPTPKALSYVDNINLESQGVKFHALGIWHKNTILKFYAPSNPNYSNYSTKNLHGTDTHVLAKCETLSRILSKLSHNTIHFLKLDVEGSWHPIMQNMWEQKITPNILCVEFDSPTNLLKAYKTIKKLISLDYLLLWNDRDNYLFCQASSLHE